MSEPIVCDLGPCAAIKPLWVSGATLDTPALGLNNIGLLVTTFGQFTPVDSRTFSVNDGSGVNVKCVVPDGVTVDQNWSFVAVTGVSSCEMVGPELHRVVRVRRQADIVAM